MHRILGLGYCKIAKDGLSGIHIRRRPVVRDDYEIVRTTKTIRDRISCFGRFDQEKQAKYEQAERKRSFQPLWQSKRPWFPPFLSGFSVSAQLRACMVS